MTKSILPGGMNVATIHGLTDFHEHMNRFIYDTHILDKNFPAQTTYRHLSDLLNVLKGTARQDVYTLEYIYESEKALIQSIIHYDSLHPDFTSKDFALETVHEFMQHVYQAMESVMIEQEAHGLPKDAITNEQRKDELKETKESLEIALATIEQWKNGWLQGESMQNAKYRHIVRKVRDWAVDHNEMDLVELIDVETSEQLT